jgi:hypothetical protein
LTRELADDVFFNVVYALGNLITIGPPVVLAAKKLAFVKPLQQRAEAVSTESKAKVTIHIVHTSRLSPWSSKSSPYWAKLDPTHTTKSIPL